MMIPFVAMKGGVTGSDAGRVQDSTALVNCGNHLSTPDAGKSEGARQRERSISGKTLCNSAAQKRRRVYLS